MSSYFVIVYSAIVYNKYIPLMNWLLMEKGILYICELFYDHFSFFHSSLKIRVYWQQRKYSLEYSVFIYIHIYAHINTHTYVYMYAVTAHKSWNINEWKFKSNWSVWRCKCMWDVSSIDIAKQLRFWVLRGNEMTHLLG